MTDPKKEFKKGDYLEVIDPADTIILARLKYVRVKKLVCNLDMIQVTTPEGEIRGYFKRRFKLWKPKLGDSVEVADEPDNWFSPDVFVADLQEAGSFCEFRFITLSDLDSSGDISISQWRFIRPAGYADQKPKLDTTIKLADGTEVELSEDSYNALLNSSRR